MERGETSLLTIIYYIGLNTHTKKKKTLNDFIDYPVEYVLLGFGPIFM